MQNKGDENAMQHVIDEAEVARKIHEDGFTSKDTPLIMRRFRAVLVGGEPDNRRWRCTWDMECFMGNWCDDHHPGSAGLDDAETTDAELAKFGLMIVDGKPVEINPPPPPPPPQPSTESGRPASRRSRYRRRG
jgi:hypothetical protein